MLSNFTDVLLILRLPKGLPKGRMIYMAQVLKLKEFATDADATIAASVRALCSGRDVAPEMVAAVVGMTKSSIYNKLKGASPWKASEVSDIASYFGVRVGDLYDGLGGKFTPQPPRASSSMAELRTFNPIGVSRKEGVVRHLFSVAA